MALEEDLSCPQCGERVIGAAQHATCPQCHVELVRNPDLEEETWQVEESTPPPDEELGAGD
jgi:Zn finger protein HypA/HybF involved in hydrogenase expression